MNKSPLLLYRPIRCLLFGLSGSHVSVCKGFLLGRWFVVFVLVFLCNPIVAAEPSGVQFFVNAPKAINEGEPVSIEIRADQPLTALKATLIDEASQKRLQQRTWRKTSPKTNYTLTPTLSKGSHHLQLQLKGERDNAQSVLSFKLSLVVLEPFEASIDMKAINLSRGNVDLRTSTALDSISMTVKSFSGHVLHKAKIKIDGAAKRAVHRLAFPPQPPQKNCVFLITAVDLSGRQKRFRFVNWHAEIPHEDIVFAQNQWRINKPEIVKLQRSIRTLNTELALYKKQLGQSKNTPNVSLFVVGMTDTVGAKDDNLVLSHRRAREIASFFHQKQLGLKVYYSGIGELGLKVPTPDETDEVRNRRAVYILTNGETPVLGYPVKHWEQL